jgi:hypothetical protein
MTEAEEFFIKLTGEIPNVKSGKMFGALCMKTPNGKSSAMIWNSDIVVKLQGESFKNAMSLDGARQFEHMEGRPMKEWVRIPFIYKDLWKEYAMISSELVSSLKKK